ncbi:MAG: ATP-binding protein [Promethearchaeia archaeon]
MENNNWELSNCIHLDPRKKYAKCIKYLYAKWKKGHSPLVLICGETNTGKSMTALKIAESLNPNFNPLENVFFGVLDFIRKLKKAKKEILIIDEAGYQLGSKEHYSLFNKVFHKVIQTQRYKNNIFIVVLPMALSLAKDHREMINLEIEMLRQGIGTTWIVQHKWGALEFDKKIIRRWYLGHIIIQMPNKKIIKLYQKKEIHDKKIILNELERMVIKEQKQKQWQCKICGSLNNYEDLNCKFCGVSKFFK